MAPWSIPASQVRIAAIVTTPVHAAAATPARSPIKPE